MVSTLEKRRGSPGLYWKQGCLCVREWSNLEKKRLHITYILISNIRFFNIKYKTLILANDFEEFISETLLSLWTSPFILIFLWHKFSLRNQCLSKISALLITNHCFCTFISFSVCSCFQVQSFCFCRTSHRVWPLHLYLPQTYLRRKHSWLFLLPTVMSFFCCSLNAKMDLMLFLCFKSSQFISIVTALFSREFLQVQNLW